MDLQERVKAAGVVGAGGAGFPTHVKLASRAEFILLNGAECEPLLRVDQQIMEIYGGEIIAGLYMAAQSVDAVRAIIGIKVKHKRVIELLKKSIGELGLDGKVEIGLLPDIYPAGDEQVLVYTLTGRVVPETGIPAAVGCVVINAETALNIFRASRGEAVTEKFVTVSGDVPNPLTAKVPVGTPYKALFDLCGRSDMTGYAVIDGGPMMGALMTDMEGFVSRKTKGLIILKEDHNLIRKKKKTMRSAVLMNKTACEQCRICTDLCPRYLLGHGTSPHKMVRSLAFSLEADETKTVALTCCQCNLCEYFSCPAGINPKMANVFYMDRLREKGIKHTPEDGGYKPRAMRDFRLVPSKRLIARLNLQSFDVKAPLVSGPAVTPELVKIPLKDFVGAPAVPVVKPGDEVAAGQLIAAVSENSLGADVHASIDGRIESVDGALIVIKRC